MRSLTIAWDSLRGRRGIAARRTARLILGLVGVIAFFSVPTIRFRSTIVPVVGNTTTLVVIGVILLVVVGIAWVMSNRAEATPNEDQLLEMRHFVNDHFAKYVARGLVAEGVGPVAISQDRAWRNVYLQHLRLHNELYAFRKDIALRLFANEIDAAVRREHAALQAAGNRVSPAIAS